MARSSNRVLCLILVALVGLALFPLPEVRSVDVVLNPVADTFIQSDTSRINGAAAQLEVRVNAVTQALSIIIMKFDLSTVPRNAEIFAARLTVRAAIVDSGGISVGSYYSTNNDWQESTATWANSGFAINPDGAMSSRVRVDEIQKDYTFDILPDVKEGVKARVLTEILKPVEIQETGRALFPSRESPDKAVQPRLAVTYAESPSTTTSPATIIAASPTRTTAATTRPAETTSPASIGSAGGFDLPLPLLAGVVGLIAVVAFGLFMARRRGIGRTGPSQQRATTQTRQLPVSPKPQRMAPVLPIVQQPLQQQVRLQPAPTSVISTGSIEWDDALKGGLPLRTSVALVGPSSQTTDNLEISFLRTNCDRGLWTVYCTTRERESVSVMLDQYPNFAVMVCHSSSDGMYQGKPRVFRTRLAPNEITIARSEIEKLIGANPRPKAALLDIVSPLMLDKELKTVRFWLGDFLQKLKQKEFSVLAYIDTSLHTKDDIAIVADVFDGQIDLVEIVEKAAKFMYIRRLADRDFEKGPIKVE